MGLTIRSSRDRFAVSRMIHSPAAVRLNSGVRPLMTPSKACPVVLRHVSGVTQILAFKHPLAGLQLVKGSIESGETPAEAALRELAEESGITHAHISRSLGTWASDHENQIWWLGLIQATSSLPSEWEHTTPDGGGLIFRFFWQPLHAALGQEWHPVYQRAIAHIRAAA